MHVTTTKVVRVSLLPGVDPGEVFGLQAVIAVRVRPPSRAVIEAFRAFVEGMPEVISIFVLTGNDDFLVHVTLRDTDHLHPGTSLRPGP